MWEHKVHVSPRNLVLGDGPFAPYGAWLDQFYSPSSVEWEELLSDPHLGMVEE